MIDSCISKLFETPQLLVVFQWISHPLTKPLVPCPVLMSREIGSKCCWKLMLGDAMEYIMGISCARICYGKHDGHFYGDTQ